MQEMPARATWTRLDRHEGRRDLDTTAPRFDRLRLGGLWWLGQSRHKRGDRGRDLGADGVASGGWGKAPRSKTALEEKTHLRHWSSPLLLCPKICYTYRTQRTPLLCEYMCRRRQQGVKRDEWVDGLDLGPILS